MTDFPWDTFPVLETERLRLRQMNLSDIPALYLMRSDPEGMKYIGRPLAKSIEDAKELFERTNQMFLQKEGINWAIELKEKPGFMGTIGFYRMKKEHYRAEVGYQLYKDHLRKGYMAEALKVVVEYGFKEMKLHTIEADVTPENIASRKLLESAEFTLDAHFRESFFFDGNFYDAVVYSMISPYHYDYK